MVNSSFKVTLIPVFKPLFTKWALAKFSFFAFFSYHISSILTPRLMTNFDTKKNLMSHSLRLRYKTCDLKSKLTALMLYVDECDHLSDQKKSYILTLCDSIARRNEELILSESELINTLDNLFPGINDAEDNKSYLVDVA